MSNLAADSIALPLDDQQTARLRDAVHDLTPAQLQWVSGYVAGLAAGTSPPAAAASDAGQALAVLYGSQTGNGEAIATALAQQASAAGFATRLVSLADYKPAALKRESLAVFVVSTHGEGDPPDDAELLHEYLLSDQAPRLDSLRFAVLALGDSSYINFCQTGRDFDQRLAALGAERIAELRECDLDYEGLARAWSDDVVARLPELLGETKPVPHLRAVEVAAPFDKQRPFAARVLVNQKITGAGSGKDVRHIELSLEGSGLRYEPGDALGIVCSNPPQLVQQLMGQLGLRADAEVNIEGRPVQLEEALQRRLEITASSLGFLQAWAAASESAELAGLLAAEGRAELTRLMETHQVIDVIRRFPASVDAEEFAAMLRPLSPRSYSIASSLAANPDEVHLTVAAVHYEAFASEHWGSASTFLTDRVGVGDTVPVFVEANKRFRLPQDDLPVIMIGPGTGVAPFRAFVEERAARGAAGENWLFFGDRTFRDDFLYQLEWLRHLKNGHLQRLDVAFSRDQAEKIYVQQRLLEQGAELYRWIEEGASIYVCGDAKQMAPDVQQALVEVLASHGGQSRDEAEAALRELRRAGRYQRDVY